MHVFVKYRVHHEVPEGLVGLVLPETLYYPISHITHVTERVFTRKKWQIPARVVWDGRRVPERIGVLSKWTLPTGVP